MTQVITVANQKGGTGKTTSAVNLLAAATFKKKRALLIDLDAQGNASYITGTDPAHGSIYDLLIKGIPAEDLIQHTPQGDVIASNADLVKVDIELKGKPEERVQALKTALQPILKNYDIVILDTSPSLNLLLLDALTVSDKVIIPLYADILSLQGLYQLINTIKDVQTKYNSGLNLTGVFFNKYSIRTILARDVTEAITDECKEMNVPILRTKIREAVAVREAQTVKESIYTYAPKSKPARDYIELMEEITK